MKELSIEEKAKAYDGNYKIYKELINRLEDVKYAIKKQNYGIAMNILCKPYPEFQITTSTELKESRDERIRQFLIHEVEETSDEIMSYRNMNKKDVLAWLEKQGTYYIKKDVDDAYLKGVTDTKKELEKQYEANYQIRKDIATFIFNYRGNIKDRAKWIDYLGIKVSFVEEQGEPIDKEMTYSDKYIKLK